MPDDSPSLKVTIEDAAAALIAAGYQVIHPGQAVPAKWMETVRSVVVLITMVVSIYAAQNVARKPSPATPEQVQAVKDVVPTAEQVADKVWAPVK